MAEPHAALGVVLHEYDWKQTEADVEFKRAIELDPNYASGHQWYGAYLRNMGRFDEAIAEGKRAIELDPLLPISYVALGSTYIAVHRYDDALAQFQKAREIEPNFPVGFLDLTYELKGMYEQLIDERRKAGSLSEKVAADLKEAYRTSGERGYWQKRLELAEESARAGNREVKPFEMARLQLQLGNKEQALDSLEKGVANGRGNQEPFRLRSNPILDPLRAEPRFKELLRKVGLPE